MAEKYNNQQVQEEDIKRNSLSGSSPKQSSTEATENNNQDNTDPDMKRAPLSRASTLDSIQEEDSELEEKFMLDSFKSITDIFENGYEEEQVPSTKPTPSATPLTSKSASLSISEDTDSLDEEVRQIMLRSEEKKSQSHEATNQVAINSLKDVAANEETKIINIEEEKKSHEEKVQEEEKEIPEEYNTDEESDGESSVPTDTESISSDSEPDSELEPLSNDEKTGHWSLRKGDDDSSDDDDEFDLEEHINKLCRHTVDYDSSSESDEGSDSDAEKQKAINKVMRMYNKKYPQEEEETESESENDDDDSSVEETDLEDNASDGIQEVEMKDDDDSSDYSSSDDDTDSDFLDDDSASISSESSANGDYDVEEPDHKDAVQGVSEEIPYLSDPVMPSHEVVFKYYLGNRPESCPEKIEVQDGDLNNNIALDNTLATRSVINLRWPFTSYYVKEFDLDSEAPTYEEDGLLPCYKSMKSSASFPGRRRDVMLGRVWWNEWWAKDAVKDQEEEEEKEEEEDGQNNNPVKKEEELEEVGEMGQFEREKINTQM